MLEKIYKNYTAFYTMVVSVAMLSNLSDEVLDKDAKEMVEFIGKSFNLDDDLIEFCKTIVTDELTSISTLEDVNAFLNTRDDDNERSELDPLLSIKCNAILALHAISEKEQIGLNPEWFNYSHYHPYTPLLRYKELSLAATGGNVLVNRTVALMSLGIGGEKNLDSAILRLSQCVYWSDIASIYLLAHAYKMKGDEKNEKIFNDLAKLAPYLEEGRTLLPKEMEDQLSNEAKNLFSYISSIKQDIILDYQKVNIDYSFVEVMMLDSISHYDKLRYINNYNRQEWKEVTNSSNSASGGVVMGFKIGGKK